MTSLTLLNFSIVERSSDRVIGVIGLLRMTVGEDAEIGYFVDRDQEGKGYMSTCLKTLLEAIWKDSLLVPLNRLIIHTSTSNGPSRQLAVKNGFKIFEETGSGVKYNLTKDEYLKIIENSQ